ncbi:choice-of-anchor L family PEP-CTERM protein [Rheinheimera pleomorphica]|uniref:choice-of-anchor L family PEP-CTERM protein n=1 Tax=Rheinheimera pleomorphica TaxID=2703963 RepID=UPI0014211829|nr:choice-of-anchor L domain-containing protein [Rheinheimera pleomorphica]
MTFRNLVVALGFCAALPAQAAIIGLDVLNPGDDAARDMTNALLGSGINVIDGSQVFQGLLGDDTTGQSALYQGASFSNGAHTVSIGSGAFLSTGRANLPNTNTSASFGSGTGTGSDSDLSALLASNGAPSTNTNDVNFIEFQFSVADGLNAISLDFIFGSEEFPDQAVTDVFGVFVDGVNYAFFPDNSLISFVTGVNAGNFNDNTQGDYDLEYDGFSNLLNLVGLLDTSLSMHTIKIAIADTSDSIYDSGVWLSNLRAISADTGGVNNPSNPVSAPGTLALMGLGLFAALRRRKPR